MGLEIYILEKNKEPQCRKLNSYSQLKKRWRYLELGSNISTIGRAGFIWDYWRVMGCVLKRYWGGWMNSTWSREEKEWLPGWPLGVEVFLRCVSERMSKQMKCRGLLGSWTMRIQTGEICMIYKEANWGYGYVWNCIECGIRAVGMSTVF